MEADDDSEQRAKLPKWIGQSIKDPDTNLSTDMAISTSKKFLRTMAQPFEQSTKSLWGLEEVIEQQQKRNGQLAEEDDGMDMDEMIGQEEQEIRDEARREEPEVEEDLFGGIDDAAFMDLA